MLQLGVVYFTVDSYGTSPFLVGKSSSYMGKCPAMLIVGLKDSLIMEAS
jgi:hypothetical protein